MPAGEAALPWLLTVALNLRRNHRRRAVHDRAPVARRPAPQHARAPSEPRVDGLSPAQAARVLGITPAAARTL